MPSTLEVDKITSTSGTSYLDAGVLSSSVVFPAGHIVQVKNLQEGPLVSGTTVMPGDDTIPQITEGTLNMTLAITPTSATNKLLIAVCWNGAFSIAHTLAIALFQDSTAGALCAVKESNDHANHGQSVFFSHWMTAGTTSSTTFTVRAGAANPSTTYFNGLSGGRYLGGAVASSMTITEILEY